MGWWAKGWPFLPFLSLQPSSPDFVLQLWREPPWCHIYIHWCHIYIHWWQHRMLVFCIIVHMYTTEPGRDTRTGQLSIDTIDGFHSIFSLGNWRTLHHHAPYWLVNIHITWPFCPLVSMVKDAMESVYSMCKGSPVFTSWWSTRLAGPKIALRFPRLFVCLFVGLFEHPLSSHAQ